MDDLIYHLRGVARAADALGLRVSSVTMHGDAPPEGTEREGPGYVVCHGDLGHSWCESYPICAEVGAVVIVSRGGATPEQITHDHDARSGCAVAGARPATTERAP